MPTLVEISDLIDPDERLRAHLAHLDEAIENAKNRTRQVNGCTVNDPDASAVTKCLELAHRLTAEAAKRRGTDVSSSSRRAQAEEIRELRHVLAAYDELPLDQWLELRTRYLR
jgi:hypothetical protein